MINQENNIKLFLYRIVSGQDYSSCNIPIGDDNSRWPTQTNLPFQQMPKCMYKTIQHMSQSVCGNSLKRCQRKLLV